MNTIYVICIQKPSPFHGSFVDALLSFKYKGRWVSSLFHPISQFISSSSSSPSSLLSNLFLAHRPHYTRFFSFLFSYNNPPNNFKMQFNIVALTAFLATAMAGPVYNPCGSGVLYTVPQCCNADVADVADLGCSTRTYLSLLCTIVGFLFFLLKKILTSTTASSLPKSPKDFNGICLHVGATPKCCTVPVVRFYATFPPTCFLFLLPEIFLLTLFKTGRPGTSVREPSWHCLSAPFRCQ